MKYEINIFYYLNIYKKHWKKMALVIIIAVLGSALIQSLLPTTYRSTLTVLATQEKSSNFGAFGNIFGISTSSFDTIFAILKSKYMRRDIDKHFNLTRQWWKIDTYIITGGFVVEVEGSDPILTKDIANFAVKNLDKINKELIVTTKTPIVKILDPATKGTPIGKKVFYKIVSSGLIAFLIYCLFIFFTEYFRELKRDYENE